MNLYGMIDIAAREDTRPPAIAASGGRLSPAAVPSEDKPLHNGRYTKLGRKVGKVNFYIRKVTFTKYRNSSRITFSQFKIIPNAFQFIVEEIGRLLIAWNNCINLLISDARVNRFRDVTYIPNTRNTNTFSRNKSSANRLNTFLSKVSLCLKNIFAFLQIFWSYELNIPVPQREIRSAGSFSCYDFSQISEFVF